MNPLRALNDALQRTTGLRVTSPAAVPPPAEPRPPRGPEDRLVTAPVFLISSVRSGSTLLRAVLDSHSQVCAPIELHQRRLHVTMSTPPAEQAMTALDLNSADLEHLLWDRLLHRELQRSSKRIVVEKTPSNVFAMGRLTTCWPDARFVFLLRHPLSAARSWHESKPAERPMPAAIEHVGRYTRAVESARKRHPGHSLRYEDLVADPETETRRLCEFLGVPWEESMLDYAAVEGGREGEFVKGIGDWSDKIRSGRIQEGRPLPAADEVPPALRAVAGAWGYPVP
ncbi:sulfotransferase family protein [Amnibacterium endophyticum]|uniref:Sulfotransferase family protein n=1 Tax=Amnibacterium endophyticum TaxID=2109337 RepID=A0ABW4LF71_9MICO